MQIPALPPGVWGAWAVGEVPVLPQPKTLDPAAYAAEGGPIGVLLIHGYTGSVAETRPMGQFLAVRGLAVRCPLLPGHGTTSQELTHIHRQVWIDEVERALCELQSRCQAVFVGGLSLGALLTLWLGATHPELTGLILMAPAVKVRNRLLALTPALRYLLKYNPIGAIGDEDLADPEAIQRIWCYDDLPLWGAAEVYRLQRQVWAVLPKVRQPILIFQGRRDAQLPPEASRLVMDRVASVDKTLVWLENSGHNLLADGERETVWAQSHAWIAERVR